MKVLVINKNWQKVWWSLQTDKLNYEFESCETALKETKEHSAIIQWKMLKMSAIIEAEEEEEGNLALT